MLLLILFITSQLHSLSAYQLSNSVNFHNHKLRLQSSTQSFADNNIALARSFATSGFGLTNPSLLDENFNFQFRNIKISKSQYLTGFSREVSSFQRASPDFDYRSYSFTVDEKDSSKIYFKIRPKGTLKGPFSYKGEVYLPNQKSFELPIQLFVLTVKDKKITSLSNGMVVDRLSGNTGGLAGPLGLLYALGESPNEFTYLPPSVVIKRFFGRKRKNIINSNQLSPFPSSVMFALASKVVDSCYLGIQPSLLTNDFLYSNPLVGPLSKEEFIRYQRQYNFQIALPDLKCNQYNFEIDAYEADRVWLIVQAQGNMGNDLSKNDNVILKNTNRMYYGPPEAVSVSINDEGLCYKITSGYVLDKSLGNTNGLGGNEGILEAIGAGLPFFETRSVSDLIDYTFEKIRFISTPTVSQTQTGSALIPTAKSDNTSSSTESIKIKQITNEKLSVQPATKDVKKNTPDAMLTGNIKQSLKNTDVSILKPVTTKAVVLNTTKSIAKVTFNPFGSFFTTKPSENKSTISIPKVIPDDSRTKLASSSVKKPSVGTVSSNSFFSFRSGMTTPKSNQSISKESAEVKPASVKVSQATINVKPSTGTVTPTKGVLTKSPVSGIKSTQSLKKTEKELSVNQSQTYSSGTLKVISETTKKYLISKKVSAAGISAIDSSLLSYQTGSLAADGVYKQLVKTVGSKDEAYEIFPYIIGSLDKGDKKTILNRYYQQQAN